MKMPWYTYIIHGIVGASAYGLISDALDDKYKPDVLWQSGVFLVGVLYVTHKILAATYKSAFAAGEKEWVSKVTLNRNDISVSISDEAIPDNSKVRSGTVHISPPYRPTGFAPRVQGLHSDGTYREMPLEGVHRMENGFAITYGHLRKNGLLLRYEAAYADGVSEFCDLVNSYFDENGSIDGFMADDATRSFLTEHRWSVETVATIWNLMQIPVVRATARDGAEQARQAVAVSMPTPNDTPAVTRRRRNIRTPKISVLAHQPRQLLLDE